MSRKEQRSAREGPPAHSRRSCSLPATREHFKSIHSIHFHLRIRRPPFPLLSILSLAVYPVAPSLPPDRHEALFLRKLALVSALPPKGKEIVKIRLSLNQRTRFERLVFRRGRFSRFSDGLEDETKGKRT